VEFTDAQGVLTWGYPFLEVKGNLFDLPPLGSYAAALFFIVFFTGRADFNYWHWFLRLIRRN
jgi:hypothetical protein